MKKTLTAVVLAISLLLPSCSLGRLFREETRRENVRIYMNDGTMLSGKAVLPDLKQKNITISPDDGKVKRIPSSEISSAVYWDKAHTDIRNILVYKNFTKSSSTKGPFWMKTAGSGRYIDICLCGAYYSFDGNGSIQVKAAPGDRIYIIGFKNGGQGEVIGTESTSASTLRNSMVKWLADDPALCRKLLGREITAKDYETICSEYNPVPEDSNGESIAI